MSRATENEGNLRALLNKLSEAIMVMDRKGIVLFANSATSDLFELATSELTGNQFTQLTESPTGREMYYSAKSGKQSILEVTRQKCTWDDESATLYTIRDITDQKFQQAAQLMEELGKQQQEKWQSLESLAGGIAHQFNNLLMIIIGNCKLLRRGLEFDQPKLDRVEYIEKSSIRAVEITSHLLAFAGLGKYEFKEINLTNTINGLKYLFDIVTLKKARIEYNLDPTVPSMYGDESQIQRMLYEIVSNATESMGRERGVISITTGSIILNRNSQTSSLQDNTLPDGGYAYIQISDNGCGMDEDTHSRIFHPLFTTKSSAKGLGLSAALGIARSHKGTISVHTLPNHGTTLEIFLPVVHQNKQNTSEELIQAANNIVNRGGTRILIAEDEAYMREMLREALESSGYVVTLAEDGRECVNIFGKADSKFDCVVLDMIMPNLDGEETFHEIRKSGSEVPIIITSGFMQKSTVDSLSSRGALFLNKPYKLNDLINLVAGVIEKNKLAASLK